MSKNVLVTNIELMNFAGSEINSCAIAKRFKDLGYTVYMGVLNYGGLIYETVKDSFDYIIDLKSNDFDFSNIEFDIVWVHHSFMLDWLIFEYNIKAKKILSSSLSPFEIFECAPIYSNYLNLVLANSQETKAKLISEGANNVMLFENYVYDSYFKYNTKPEKLNNIAVVSNHITDDLLNAIELLKENYNVDIYGSSGKRVLITDKILKNYDLVITIGKTVQYAMALSIPVYIYDRFGGPGYLTMDNIKNNRSHNFSGRGYTKKTSDEICRDITDNYDIALHDVDEIKKYAYKNFNFENNFAKVLDYISSSEDVDIIKIKEEYKKYERNLGISRKIMLYTMGKYNDRREIEEKIMLEIKTESANLKTENTSLKNELQSLKQEKAALETRLDSILHSRSWRYTKIFRSVGKK